MLPGAAWEAQARVQSSPRPASHRVPPPRVPTNTPTSQQPLQPGAGPLKEDRPRPAAPPWLTAENQSGGPRTRRGPGAQRSPSPLLAIQRVGHISRAGPWVGRVSLSCLWLCVPLGESRVTLLSPPTVLTLTRSPLCPRVSRSLSPLGPGALCSTSPSGASSDVSLAVPPGAVAATGT